MLVQVRCSTLKAFGKQPPPLNISRSLISCLEWAGAPSPQRGLSCRRQFARMSYGPRLGHPALTGPVPLFTRNNHIQIAPLTTYTYSSPPAHGLDPPRPPTGPELPTRPTLSNITFQDIAQFTLNFTFSPFRQGGIRFNILSSLSGKY